MVIVTHFSCRKVKPELRRGILLKNRKRYEVIKTYFKEVEREEQAKETISEWERYYLKLLLEGMQCQNIKLIEEATEQIDYVKSVCERFLTSKDPYVNMAYLAGIMVGEARVGTAWIRNQMEKDAYYHNMKILLVKEHMKDIIESIYNHPWIQHKDLAKQVGIKPNYLSQLIMQLEEVQCVRSFRSGKSTCYELTIRGNEYAKKEI